MPISTEVFFGGWGNETAIGLELRARATLNKGMLVKRGICYIHGIVEIVTGVQQAKFYSSSTRQDFYIYLAISFGLAYR